MARGRARAAVAQSRTQALCHPLAGCTCLGRPFVRGGAIGRFGRQIRGSRHCRPSLSTSSQNQKRIKQTSPFTPLSPRPVSVLRYCYSTLVFHLFCFLFGIVQPHQTWPCACASSIRKTCNVERSVARASFALSFYFEVHSTDSVLDLFLFWSSRVIHFGKRERESSTSARKIDQEEKKARNKAQISSTRRLAANHWILFV